MTAGTKGDAVMVTTKHRGVFAGLLDSEDGDVVTLGEIRMCVYWSQSERGVLGLAGAGPGPKCRITPAAPRGVLRDVTGVFPLTAEAWERWRAEPWG